MEKPKVFASPINKPINNSQEIFYEGRNTNMEERVLSREDINKKINDIFNGTDYIYKSRVEIVTRDDNIVCDIVGKTKANLLTIDGKTIRIVDILDIKKI